MVYLGNELLCFIFFFCFDYFMMYTQKGKMVYMMKNTIKEELLGEVTGEMGPSLKEAKHIVQAEGGKFITAVDGQTFKAGILLSTAN